MFANGRICKHLIRDYTKIRETILTNVIFFLFLVSKIYINLIKHLFFFSNSKLQIKEYIALSSFSKKKSINLINTDDSMKVFFFNSYTATAITTTNEINNKQPIFTKIDYQKKKKRN